MSDAIKEVDWKVFREVQPIALDRFCKRILGEVAGIAADGTKTNHERYLAVFRLIRERDDEIAGAFNDFRRSTAIYQIAQIKRLGLLTEEELARFSDETRGMFEFLGGAGRG
jgi:hypothetical protein